jgi:hypothetical protein
VLGGADVDEPRFNVDHFRHHPTHNLVGLLTDKSEIPGISKELEAAGVDISAVDRSCAATWAQPSWMSMAVTTDFEVVSYGPFSGSATTRRPWRPITRR